jgi:hypothetical protein
MFKQFIEIIMQQFTFVFVFLFCLPSVSYVEIVLCLFVLFLLLIKGEGPKYELFYSLESLVIV